MKNYFPDTVSQEFYLDTIDTPENRFLKYFIELIDKLIHNMIEHFKGKDDGYIMSKLVEYQIITQNYLNDRWTREWANYNIFH